LQGTPAYISTLSNLSENTVYFARDNEIWELSIPQLEIKKSPRYNFFLKNEYITTIYADQWKQLWIGSRLDGFFILDGKGHNRNFREENNPAVLSNYIRKIIGIDSKIYIGSLNGLMQVDQQLNITTHKRQANVPHSISQNSIYDIFLDRQNIIWTGTYYGGINAVYPDLTPFRTASSKSFNKQSLNSNVVSSIAEYRDSYFIGTDEDGVYRYDKRRGSISKLPYNFPTQLVKNVKVFGDKLYVAFHAGGFSVVDLKHGTYKNIHIGSLLTDFTNNVWDILVEGDVAYIATEDGLYRHTELQHPELVEETKGQNIQQLIRDEYGNIFVLAGRKLWRKDAGASKFVIEKSLDSLYIQHISLHENDIWISTGPVVYCLGSDGRLQEMFSSDDISIGSIHKTEDIVWCGTDKGLLRVELSSGKRFLFNRADGLPVNDLLYSRFYKDSRDELFITTLNGIVYFNPKSVKVNTTTPTAYLTDFKIYGESLLERDSLSADISPSSINLDYNQNFFTIHFASDNLIKSKKNKYKFQLTGFDKEWTSSTEPNAQYMNVPPGIYTFKVYTANNDGIWSPEPFEITIKISPPLWKTWWAYLLYIALLIFVTYILLKFIIERKILLNSEKEHAKKINFFTQVSHEIRTPLTLITVPLNDLFKSTKHLPDINLKIGRLHKNANKLLNIVNELLDFRKIESGYQPLNQNIVHFKSYLEDFFYLFSDLAIAKNLNFYIKKLDDPGFIAIDIKQFDKALFNLMSNAIKYCHEKGIVFLETKITENKFLIRIVDNGIGISNNNQFKIFEEYYRDPKAEDSIGTGIGLAITKQIVEQHQGKVYYTPEKINDQPHTVFTIELPLELFQTDRPEEEDAHARDDNYDHFIEKTSGKHTILLVEDNREMAEVISNSLKDYYHVIYAHDGETGVLKAKQHLPDLIISDIMMPNKNGLELCNDLKSDVLTAHTPIILLTADTKETTQISGLKYGANAYLHKPFDPEILLLTTQNLLQIARQNRKNYTAGQSGILSDIDQDFIKELEKIIDQNLSNHLFNVDFLASELGISQHILYKKLKAITDLSVSNFIKRYRFQKAFELLKVNSNVTEAAYAVGFSDRKYFSKEFKKYFGKNPSEIHNDDKST
jgi:signal transduction histidine kinase/AraC-like DNA-binding protein/ligand-binding sensor domain-containing protein